MEYLQAVCDWITGKAEKDALEIFIKGNARFTFQFYQSLMKDKPADLLYCPAHIQVILAMLWIGAQEKGLEQIEELLQLPSDRDVVLGGGKALLKYLQTLKYVTLDAPLRIYTPGHVRLKKDFYVTCGRHFDVRLRPTMFRNDTGPIRDAINDWVKRSTHNKVDQIIVRQRVDDSTQILIVNGINFECRLAVPFLACDTTSDLFHVTSTEYRTVKFMNQTGMLRYSEFEELQARVVELPYKCPRLNLLLMLPFSIDGITDLERKLPTLELMELRKIMAVQRVQMTIPSFRLLDGFDATDQLFDIGLEALMETRASGLGNIADHPTSLTLTQLRHKVYFEFAEEGSEPKSAGVVKLPEDPRIPTKVFRADHPFIFMVIDNTTGLIIIIGRLSCRDRFDVSMLRTNSGSKLAVPDMSNRRSRKTKERPPSPSPSPPLSPSLIAPLTS